MFFVCGRSRRVDFDFCSLRTTGFVHSDRILSSGYCCEPSPSLCRPTRLSSRDSRLEPWRLPVCCECVSPHCIRRDGLGVSVSQAGYTRCLVGGRCSNLCRFHDRLLLAMGFHARSESPQTSGNRYVCGDGNGLDRSALTSYQRRISPKEQGGAEEVDIWKVGDLWLAAGLRR